MHKDGSFSSNVGCALVLFSVIGAAIAIGWMQYDSWQHKHAYELQRQADLTAQQAVDQKKRDTLALREWAPIPFDPPPPLGVLPKVPDIEEATRFDVSPEHANDQAWQLNEIISRRLKFMVAQIPDQADRNLIENETVTLVTMGLGGSSRGGWDAIFTDAGEDAGHRPVMLIDHEAILFPPRKTSFIATTEEILDFDLVLSHELVHYRQWLARDPAGRKVFEIAAVEDGEKISPELCADKWQLEREAYEAMCRTGYAWGVSKPRNLAFCDRVNTRAAFDQGLFQAMTSGVESKRGVGTRCAATFARLAGHPHPEAFEP